MRGPEAIIEDAIVAWVKSIGGLALKLKLDNERGFPDRTLLLPKSVVIFVEVKRVRGGKVSKQQEQWIAKLEALGFTAIVATSLEQVKEQYRVYDNA